MTKNDSINAGLQAIATLFGAGAVTMFNTNFWYSVACAVLCLVSYAMYELLP